MKKIIFFVQILLLLLLGNYSLASSQYYKIDIGIDQGIVNKCGVRVLGGEINFSKDSYLNGDYRLDLISFEDEVLEKLYFNDSDFSSLIEIPYYANAKEIKIYKNEKEIYYTDIAYFSDVCGDGNCQAHESYETCPEDCLSGESDDYCDEVQDGKCDPDCVKTSLDRDCQNLNLNKTEKNINIFNIQIIILVFVILLIIFLAYFFLIS